MSVGLPDALAEAVAGALSELGHGGGLARARPVGGGCIHNGSRVETEDGAAYFLKWSRETPGGMFDAEADGLRALGAPDTLAVPRPLAWSDGPPGWLLMEFIEPGPGRADTALGEGLAHLHTSVGEATFGWTRDNWIGSLPQRNPVEASWGTFWRDARLAPQLERARRSGRLRDERFDRLLDAVPEALSGVATPALIHGDLWAGNAFTSREGRPVVVDPAVYRGDGEVDLAMSELFGGFGTAFYEAYDAARAISPEYTAFKRDLYQLYYLLVHVNLFGASYEAGARRAADAALRGMGRA